jgi:hypothetical protein
LLANAMDELALDMRAIETSQTDSAPTVEPSESIAGKLGPEELATACRREAAKLRDFHGRWHTLVRSEGVSVLPIAGDSDMRFRRPYSPSCHDRVLSRADRRGGLGWLLLVAWLRSRGCRCVWSENVVEWRAGVELCTHAVCQYFCVMLWLGLSTWSRPAGMLTRSRPCRPGQPGRWWPWSSSASALD